jgi:hypothetical protein
MERIYHTWDKWECYPAGFYEDAAPNGMTARQAVEAYRDFLADLPRFEGALQRVITEWPNSCEHYLTNTDMNRLAWLGQAAMCIETRVPSVYRGGFSLLTSEQKDAANAMALIYLNKWLAARGEPELTMDNAKSRTQPNLY